MGVRQTVDTTDRYVVLVVGAGADFGELPGVEMLRCADPAEATVWLEGSRPWSALVADPRHGALMEAAQRRGVPVADLNATDLPEFLRRRARPIRSAHDLGRCGAALSGAVPASTGAAAVPGGAACGAIVSVCGPGGTGVSTVAMAVAAGLAAIHGPGIVLADLALRAGQAVLHQVAPTSVGLEELVARLPNRPPERGGGQRSDGGAGPCRLPPAGRAPPAVALDGRPAGCVRRRAGWPPGHIFRRGGGRHRRPRRGGRDRVD